MQEELRSSLPQLTGGRHCWTISWPESSPIDPENSSNPAPFCRGTAVFRIMKDRLPKRLLCPARMQTCTREKIAVTACTGEAVASQDESEMSPQSAASLSSI